MLEEISRTEDTPDDRVHELFARTLWPDHPLGLPGPRPARDGRRRSTSTQAVAFHERALRDRQRRGRGRGRRRARRDRRARRRSTSTLPDGAAQRRASHATPTVESAPRRCVTKETEQAHICWGVPGLHATRRRPLHARRCSTRSSAAAWLAPVPGDPREERAWRTPSTRYHALYQDTGAVHGLRRHAPGQHRAGRRASSRPRSSKITQDGITAEELDRAKESHQGSARARPREHAQPHDAPRQGRGHRRRAAVARRARRARRRGHRSRTCARWRSGCSAAEHALAMIGPFDADDVEHLLD